MDEFEDHRQQGRPVKQVHRSEKCKKVATKQIDTAELSRVLPNEADDESTDLSTDDEILRRWSTDSVLLPSSDTESFSTASVQVHVPAHLQQDIKEEPILTDFREPTEVECSWDMPSLRERAKDLPVGIRVAPHREMHNKHVKKLDDYLNVVSATPRRLEAQVRLKKMMSGMIPVRFSESEAARRKREALNDLRLF